MSTINLTNPLQEAEREWEERTLEPTLKRSPETRKTFTTVSPSRTQRTGASSTVFRDTRSRECLACKAAHQETQAQSRNRNQARC